MKLAPPPEPSEPLPRRVAWLVHPRLAWILALASTLVLLPTLGLGFHLDDYVHRFLYSELPGSTELLYAYQSPFGIANGEPRTNHWQVEEGYAPWWTYPRLLISLWRPISEWSTRLDALLWPSSAPLQHAHSLCFYFALAFVTTRLYRALLGPSTIAGLAAAMYAFDPAHGFAVGWIANRNALIASSLGVLALFFHHRARSAARGFGFALLSLASFVAALLAGEGAVAIFGYLLGYALFLEPDRKHALFAIAPHALALVAWRVTYSALGRGAAFSGLYLDPVRDPLRFAVAVCERLPLLVLGELEFPPAELYHFLPPPFALFFWLLALATCVWFVYSLWPILRAERSARFWAFGMLASLPPACTTHANDRLLFFVGIGALALVSQLWHALMNARRAGEPPRRIANLFAATSVGYHLLVAPLLLPLSAFGIALTSRAEAAAESALELGRGRDLVIVSSPDYFYVKLLPVLAALEEREPPRRLRALSFGAVPLVLDRPDERTLDLQFQGGLLASPLLELYRARELVMPVGSHVPLAGMDVEVRALTRDRRIAAARFRFSSPLDDPRYAFVFWDGERYRTFELPEVGGRTRLPAASLPFALDGSESEHGARK